MIIAIFGVGANISIYKDENKHAADNGILYGTILSILIFSFIIFNSNKYISFMNMDNTITAKRVSRHPNFFFCTHFNKNFQNQCIVMINYLSLICK